jgi:hypothetical protein
MKNETTNEISATPRKHHALWISAIALAVIALFQLGLSDRAAIAAPLPADVASSGDYTMLTLTQSNEDLLLVLDGRNETLSVYHVRNKTSFEIIGGEDLKSIFARGKRIGAGTK